MDEVCDQMQMNSSAITTHLIGFQGIIIPLNEWLTERKDLHNEIDNLKEVNDERVKEIEKLKNENRGVRKEVWMQIITWKFIGED